MDAAYAPVRSLQGSTSRIKMLHHRQKWVVEARPKQLPPEGKEWDIWLILAGRGFGKTRLGAENLAWDSWKYPDTISHVIAATHGDLRSVCYEGQSGLLNIIPAECIKTNGYNRSLSEIYLTNGSIIRGFSAEAPDRLRGPQCHRLWGDEVAAWDTNKGNAQATFDMATLGLRLGDHAYMALTTTPKPIMLIRNLINLASGRITEHNKKLTDLRVKVTTGSTDENYQNLARNFQTIINQYRGTRLGRQELDAEVLEDIQGALWGYDTINENRIPEDELPEMVRIVVSIDPAASSNENSNETGIIVAGIGDDNHGYILHDASGVMPADVWARRAIELYNEYRADCIIAEVNNGGDMVEATLRGADPNIPYRSMRATRGKVMRAEPVAALYEQAKVHHVGLFPKLEDQLCSLTLDFNKKKAGYSPDRADALVWAITELLLGEMDSLGIYEYYRKQAEEIRRPKPTPILRKSGFGQTVVGDEVELQVNQTGISTIFGMNGEKIIINGNTVRVPKELVPILLKQGFSKVLV